MIDYCIKFWILYSGSAVGRHYPDDGDANDSQNLRLRMDYFDWIFRNDASSNLPQQKGKFSLNMYDPKYGYQKRSDIHLSLLFCGYKEL